MNKKIKIAYTMLIALNAVVLIVELLTARYVGAIISANNIVWLLACFMLTNLIFKQDALINELLRLHDEACTRYRESAAREKIAAQTIAELRDRAQNAEQAYQALLEDTPARGDNGKFKKRESNESENH